MPETTDALIETRDHLMDAAQRMVLRRDISKLQKAISGRSMDYMETTTGRIDPEQYEHGFGDARFAWANSLPNDRYRGQYYPFFQTDDDLARIRAIGRWFAMADETGVGARGNLINYTIGDGFGYEVQPRRKDVSKRLVEEVQDAVDAFLDANDWVGDRERKPMEEAIADGEVFLPLRPGPDYIPHVSIKTGEHFQEPTKPRELEDHFGLEPGDWTFGIHTPFGDPSQPKAYFAEWYGELGNWEMIPAESLQHVKLNVPEDVKRGVSDFYAAYRDMERAAKGFESTAIGAAIQASIAYIEEHAGGATIDEIQTALATPATVTKELTSLDGGIRDVMFEQFLSGRVVRTNGTKFQYGPQGSPSGPNLIDVFQAVLRRVGSRWQMPEYMISGDASNNNMASTVVAESPFHKSTRSRQKDWGTEYVKLSWKALTMMILNGWVPSWRGPISQLKRLVRIVVVPPDITERNAVEDENIRKIRHEAGILSAETWAEQADLDYEAEVARGAKPMASPGPLAPPAAGPLSTMESRREAIYRMLMERAA